SGLNLIRTPAVCGIVVGVPRIFLLYVLLLFVSESSAWAVVPSQPVGSYLPTHFTEFPANVVDSIAQSRDGFLWLASGGQLIRYDGHHFTVFDQPINILTVALGPDGDLWVGTTDHLERIPATALNQSGPLRGTSYHPGPGIGSDITCLLFTR